MGLVILQISETGNALAYIPIAIQLIFAIILVVAIMFISHYLGPRRKTDDKLQNFESGIEIKGDARQPVAIKYFLVAILFVLFDVEVIFFYPYAVNFREFAKIPEMGWHTFMAVVLFVGLFIAGFIYIIRKGALSWED